MADIRRDWTLHTEPSPPHPSYRLVPALRLLHVPFEDQAAFQKWEATVIGTADDISPRNTQQVRKTLCDLCSRAEKEAIQWLETSFEQEFSMDIDQLDAWRSIKFLWEQQRDISALVRDSILSGLDM